MFVFFKWLFPRSERWTPLKRQGATRMAGTYMAPIWCCAVCLAAISLPQPRVLGLIVVDIPCDAFVYVFIRVRLHRVPCVFKWMRETRLSKRFRCRKKAWTKQQRQDIGGWTRRWNKKNGETMCVQSNRQHEVWSIHHFFQGMHDSQSMVWDMGWARARVRVRRNVHWTNIRRYISLLSLLLY